MSILTSFGTPIWAHTHYTIIIIIVILILKIFQNTLLWESFFFNCQDHFLSF